MEVAPCFNDPLNPQLGILQALLIDIHQHQAAVIERRECQQVSYLSSCIFVCFPEYRKYFQSQLCKPCLKASKSTFAS